MEQNNRSKRKKAGMKAAEWKTLQEQVLKNREEHKLNGQEIDRKLEKQFQKEFCIRAQYGLQGNIITEDEVDSDGNRTIKMRKADNIIFGLTPTNMQAKPSDAKRAAGLLKENRLPEHTLNVVEAKIFQDAGIPVRTVKGDLIPDGTPHVYVPIDDAATQAYAKAYQVWNQQAAKAGTENAPKIPSIRIIEIKNLEEFYRMQADQSSIERCRNYKEKVRLAGETSSDEVLEEAHRLSHLHGIPFEETLWAQTGGKRFKQSELAAMMKGEKIDWEVEELNNTASQELKTLLYGNDSKISKTMLRKPALRKAVRSFLGNNDGNDWEKVIGMLKDITADETRLRELNAARSSNDVCLLFGKLSSPSVSSNPKENKND